MASTLDEAEKAEEELKKELKLIIDEGDTEEDEQNLMVWKKIFLTNFQLLILILLLLLF